MKKTSKNNEGGMKGALIERPPVVVVMGHVDHGKSTLLDYIRKTNVTEKEVGGITQKMSAYEVEQELSGNKKKITFLDTPGHESFQSIRARGAKTADIAILVVSAEDGVKPQTKQALATIIAEEIPYIVAINKIDRPGADIERTKQSLSENEIYVEGYGGNISVVPISAKTGEGIPELLEMILLVAEVEELTADESAQGQGNIIETHVDRKKGNTATVVITNGTISSGQFVVAGKAYSPIRIFENFASKPIKEATFSSPVRIIGWNELPAVGDVCIAVESKKEAEAIIEAHKQKVLDNSKPEQRPEVSEKPTLPIIIKASETGGLEALIHEINKIKNDALNIRIVQQSVGDIGENDIKAAAGVPGTIILGFGVGIDAPARSLAENQKTNMHMFDIIYKLTEWLQDYVKERAPKVTVEVQTGLAKVLKTFSKSKDKQILGGRVEEGVIRVGEEVKIVRRDNVIERGRIRELQQLKERASEVEQGKEFGAMIESGVEIMPGDRIQCFSCVEK